VALVQPPSSALSARLAPGRRPRSPSRRRSRPRWRRRWRRRYPAAHATADWVVRTVCTHSTRAHGAHSLRHREQGLMPRPQALLETAAEDAKCVAAADGLLLVQVQRACDARVISAVRCSHHRCRAMLAPSLPCDAHAITFMRCARQCCSARLASSLPCDAHAIAAAASSSLTACPAPASPTPAAGWRPSAATR
jgi:hypothetical protein